MMETPKFRRKPVVIEAVQYAGAGNMNPRGGVPDWLWDALDRGTAYFTNGGDPLRVKTLNGEVIVAPNDWIIRGIQGELYPCNPEIFAATYEPAAAPPAAAPPPPTRLHPSDALRALAVELRAILTRFQHHADPNRCECPELRAVADRLDALAASTD